MDKIARKQLLDLIEKARVQIHKVIIGLDDLIDSIFICLFVPGRQPGDPFGSHLLIEGSHGLGKSKLVEVIGLIFDLNFKRLQCTPELMPSDIAGFEYQDLNNPAAEPVFKKGPIFTDLLLADELNRTPPKVQSALLEPMEERKVSVGGKEYRLSEYFRVFATVNPYEETGTATYPLPIAQIDRFLINHRVEWLSKEQEEKVAASETQAMAGLNQKIMNRNDLKAVSDFIAENYPIQAHSPLNALITEIVRKTRLAEGVDAGASTRAAIDLHRAAKCLAFLSGEDIVLPTHVAEASFPVLRKRLILSGEYSSISRSPDEVIMEILAKTKIRRQ